MLVMIDTNILISGIVLSSKYIRELISVVEKNHELILPDYIINEFKSTTRNKFPDKYYLAESFLENFAFEIVYAPEISEEEKFPSIRDVKDLPILISSILYNADILITNDKDFRVLDITRPEILDPKEFLEKYNINEKKEQ